MKFHEKLYTLRKGADMTQTDLAEKLNVSRQAVSRWEMGSAMPDIDNLIAMSDLFGVSLDDLLKNKEDVPEGAVPPSKEDNPRYWDYVPKKWWVPLVIAGVAVACDFLWVFLIMLFPGFSTFSAALFTDFPFLRIFSLIFNPIVFVAVARISPWISVGCLLCALMKWQKAKK